MAILLAIFFHDIPPLKLPLPACLKLVRIMLEIGNLENRYKKYVISENLSFSTRKLLILLMSALFLQKSELFWQKYYFYSNL